MNTYERVVKESLESIQSSPSAGLKNRVMRSIDNETNENIPIIWRRIPIRAALIAAIIGVIALTTAFTFGNEIVTAIRQIMFGDSIATQVVSDSDHFIGGWGVHNRSDLDASDYPLGVFYTLGEARQAAPFPIREPSYLPDNVTGLRSVGVWRLEDPDIPWKHFVDLNYNILLENGGNVILMLRQTYAGPDAYFVIENVSPMELVMVGDSEAVLISAPYTYIRYDGTVVINDDIIGFTLHWLHDGIAFTLSADHHDWYTPEIMIAIAESVR